jgi:hypothetical protein
MVSWISSFIGFFRSEKCQKLINYDGRTLIIKGLQANIPSVPIEVGQFETKYEKIRDAAEVAQTLDDYQFQMCKILRGMGKDDPEWRKYNELRVSTLQTITSFRLNLIAMKEGVRDRKEELDKTVQKMNEALKVEQQAIPSERFSKISSKEEIPKTEVPPLGAEALSDVKKIVEVDENDLGRFLDALQRGKASEPSTSVANTLLEVHSLIYSIKDQYVQAINKEESAEDIYNGIQSKINELYQKKEYRDVIGRRKAEELSLLSANQTANVNKLRNAKLLGDAREEDEAMRKVILTNNTILSKLTDLEFSLG